MEKTKILFMPGTEMHKNGVLREIGCMYDTDNLSTEQLVTQQLSEDYVAKKTQILENSICKHKWTYHGDGTPTLRVLSRISSTKFFIVFDPYNYGVTYPIRGTRQMMCPDKHSTFLIRALSAIENDPSEIIIIMPCLYAGRQHKRDGREDLMPANFLRTLESHNVKKVITFDMHSNSLDCAMKNTSLHNYSTRKLLLDTYVENNPPVPSENIFVLGTDKGAVDRSENLAKIIGEETRASVCDKGRDENNNITRHMLFTAPRYLRNKHVIITDDILDTGKSLLGVFKRVKKCKPAQIDVLVSFGILSEGLKNLIRAKRYKHFNILYITNLVYLPPEAYKLDWIKVVDASKILGDIIYTAANDKSDKKFFEM